MSGLLFPDLPRRYWKSTSGTVTWNHKGTAVESGHNIDVVMMVIGVY